MKYEHHAQHITIQIDRNKLLMHVHFESINQIETSFANIKWELCIFDGIFRTHIQIITDEWSDEVKG